MRVPSPVCVLSGQSSRIFCGPDCGVQIVFGASSVGIFSMDRNAILGLEFFHGQRLVGNDIVAALDLDGCIDRTEIGQYLAQQDFD
jgi:hypothetical protein